MMDRSAYSILESEPRERPFTLLDSLDTGEDKDTTYTWILVLSGLLWALAIASLACHLPDNHRLPARTILIRSIAFVALSLFAGIAGVAVIGLLFRLKPSFGLIPPLAIALPAAVFLPSLTLLYRQDSPWTLLLVAILTLLVLFGLRRALPQADSPPSSPIHLVDDLPNLYGLPPSDARYRVAALIAFFAQAALFCALTGLLFLANILVALAILLLLRLVPSANRRNHNSSPWKKKTALLSLLAILLTTFTLLPWMGGHLVRASVARPSAPTSTKAVPQPEPNSPASDYIGIILWPPPIKKRAILPPIPHPHTLGPGRLTQPLVIPFDGPYWYFKSPAKGPGPHAHIARGLPTDSNVRSSDRAPLYMQAHQNLSTPIALSCCAEIDLALTNADNRSGAIQLGLLLSDSTTPGKPTLYLGAKVVPSSAV